MALIWCGEGGEMVLDGWQGGGVAPRDWQLTGRWEKNMALGKNSGDATGRAFPTWLSEWPGTGMVCQDQFEPLSGN